VAEAIMPRSPADRVFDYALQGRLAAAAAIAFALVTAGLGALGGRVVRGTTDTERRT
jgi:hypothetical protein